MYSVKVKILENVCCPRLSVVCTTYVGGNDQDKSKDVFDLEKNSTKQEAAIWVSFHCLYPVSYAYNDTELKDVSRVRKLQLTR